MNTQTMQEDCVH